jgi:hypothetical protein
MNIGLQVLYDMFMIKDGMPMVISSPPVVGVVHVLTVPYGEQVCTLSDTHGQTINIYLLWDFLPILS